MMVFPTMLVSAAQKAGMKVPPDPDNFHRKEYPHFEIFCLLQLCRSMRPGEHWNNAKVIAALPAESVMSMTLEQFLVAGLEWRS